MDRLIWILTEYVSFVFHKYGFYDIRCGRVGQTNVTASVIGQKASLKRYFNKSTRSSNVESASDNFDATPEHYTDVGIALFRYRVFSAGIWPLGNVALTLKQCRRWYDVALTMNSCNMGKSFSMFILISCVCVYVCVLVCTRRDL